MTRLVSALVVALAAGCVSAPLAPREVDLAAKEFRPTPGKVNLYVFRHERWAKDVAMAVLLDGRFLGMTTPRTYLYAQLEPGRHVLASLAELHRTEVEVTAEAGSTVYVWQEVKFGVFTTGSALHLVEEARARERVSACALAETRQPPPAWERLPPPEAPGAAPAAAGASP